MDDHNEFRDAKDDPPRGERHKWRVFWRPESISDLFEREGDHVFVDKTPTYVRRNDACQCPLLAHRTIL